MHGMSSTKYVYRTLEAGSTTAMPFIVEWCCPES